MDVILNGGRCEWSKKSLNPVADSNAVSNNKRQFKIKYSNMNEFLHGCINLRFFIYKFSNPVNTVRKYCKCLLNILEVGVETFT